MDHSGDTPRNKEERTTGCRPQENRELESLGWQFRFVGDQRMVREAAENYREMGWEVKILPHRIDNLAEECRGCALVLGSFSVIYTRARFPIQEGAFL